MTDEARMADDGCTQEPVVATVIERDPIWQAIVDRHDASLDEGCEKYDICWDDEEKATRPLLTDRRSAIWYWWHYGSDHGGEPIPGIQEEMHKYGLYADGWGDA